MRRQLCVLALAALGLATAPATVAGEPKWLSGDFHQHTWYTDGATSFDYVMAKNAEFGLDWWANSEHGGSRNRDGNNQYWDVAYPAGTILGALQMSGNHRVMWRWQSLRDFVYADIVRNRAVYPDKTIFSGVEWNVPGHEHCSVGIVAPNADAVAAFEYMFDTSDVDFSREGEVTPYGTLSKQNGRYNFSQGPSSVRYSSKTYPERHADSVAACAWMQRQLEQSTIDNGWIVFAHVERAGDWDPSSGGGYNVEHFRDFNNAGPNACVGFEGAPGHQVNELRGLGNLEFGGTYGGVGYYTAQVGGLWDALLGEGRRYFNYASSDYHAHYTVGGDDFFPGEYQRNWVKADDADGDGTYSLNEIANALRAGRSFFVHGDLVNFLDFSLKAKNRGVAEMGGTLVAQRGDAIQLTIKFKSPAVNANGDTPVVDHVDLIMGEYGTKIDPADPRYTDATNPTATVIATFDRNSWRTDADGNTVISYAYKVQSARNVYFRLRGTNLAPCTEFETDCQGNPLPDHLVTDNLGIDMADEAWRDLWFYSNPIFLEVR
ncbi:MAG: hypothetical protein MUC67_03255 [Acidobacteria bacterium]|jgi:hypothetical protein|nr:hypothetical protein [Acidobacteriota bacterium]